jgi:hypothetical protein
MGWSGPVAMGYFMAEVDPGRPKATPRTFERAKQEDFSELQLYAHWWPARTAKPGSFRILKDEGAYEWKSDGFHTFEPFDARLDEQLRTRACFEVEIRPGGSAHAFTGHIYADDERYRLGELELPDDLICIVINTETVRHINGKQTATGYYILGAKYSTQKDNYERLGVGVAVSKEDVIPKGWFGRSAPSQTIVLV